MFVTLYVLIQHQVPWEAVVSEIARRPLGIARGGTAREEQATHLREQVQNFGDTATAGFHFLHNHCPTR